MKQRLMRALKASIRRSVRGSLLSFGGGFGGIGDDLLCTTVARELYRRQGRRIWIISSYRELFQGNRDVYGVVAPNSRGAFWLPKLVGCGQCHDLHYERHDKRSDTGIAPREHILATMCRQVFIRGPILLRPYAYVSQKAATQGRRFRGWIAIQSSGLGARGRMLNKEWRPERFSEAALGLMKRHKVVQIGAVTDPAIPCDLDLRGKTSLRELALTLANCRLFVGLVGFPMHLARAVDCPAVIVYGGRELPHQSGYMCNVNLFSQLPCTPCWQWNRCEFDRSCMTGIGVAAVLQGVAALLDRPRDVLAVDQAIL